MASGSDGPAQLRVQRLDGVRRVDNFGGRLREREERNDKVRVAAPALRDRWILLAPRTSCEGIEGGLADLGIGRAIDGPKRLRDVCDPSRRQNPWNGGSGERCRLNDRLRENRIDPLQGKPFRPSTTAIRMSWTPRIFSSLHHAQPNWRPSVRSIQMPSISLVPSGRKLPHEGRLSDRADRCHHGHKAARGEDTMADQDLPVIANFAVRRRAYIAPDGGVLSELPNFASNQSVVVSMYRAMAMARSFDLKAVSLQRTGRLGTYATSLGQEAVGVGIASAMRPEDVLLPSYRDNAALLLRGVKMEEILLFWGGDEQRGNCWSGPAHDFPFCIPVGSQAPHAAGVPRCDLHLRRRGNLKGGCL